MLILALLAWGMIAGWVASWLLNLVTRGSTRRSWGLLLVAGLVGSFVGGLLASLIAGDGLALRPSGFIGSVVGAIVVLALVAWFERRRQPAPSRAHGGRTTSKSGQRKR